MITSPVAAMSDSQSPVANVGRFSGRVENYEKYRLRYPTEEVLKRLREWIDLRPNANVADIGAGTGMLAEVFLENGNCVIGVEPNEEMCAVCVELESKYPNQFQLKCATAEETTIEQNSIDVVSVGRAFHWFDQPKAIEEFRRILKKKGGWVVFAATGRWRVENPIGEAYEEILEKWGIDYKEVRLRAHAELDDADALFFQGGKLFADKFFDDVNLTLEEFLGMTQSYSVTPMPGHPNYEPMMKALKELYRKYQDKENSYLILPIQCTLRACQFKEDII